MSTRVDWTLRELLIGRKIERDEMSQVQLREKMSNMICGWRSCNSPAARFFIWNKCDGTRTPFALCHGHWNGLHDTSGFAEIKRDEFVVAEVMGS